MKQLRALPLSPDALQRVLALSTGGAGAHGQAGGGSSTAGQIRVDVRKGAKGAITYMNNIEKDAMYKAWSTDVRALLKPSWQLHQVRRNLFTLVLVIDPTSTEGLMAVMTCSQMIRQQIPIRVGIILAKAKGKDQVLGTGDSANSVGSRGFCVRQNDGSPDWQTFRCREKCTVPRPLCFPRATRQYRHVRWCWRPSRNAGTDDGWCSAPPCWRWENW